MPRVLNKHWDDIPKDAVYIGRGSKWGNPYKIGQDFGYTRDRVIELYVKWLEKRPGLVKQIKQELKGKDLVCFCSPLPCHGDVLIKIANEE